MVRREQRDGGIEGKNYRQRVPLTSIANDWKIEVVPLIAGLIAVAVARCCTSPSNKVDPVRAAHPAARACDLPEPASFLLELSTLRQRSHQNHGMYIDASLQMDCELTRDRANARRARNRKVPRRYTSFCRVPVAHGDS